MGQREGLEGVVEESYYSRLKFVFLSITFFFVIAGYTVAKELKDSIFVSIVGRTYVPTAKILSMLVLIPAIFIYSKLVDKVRRYQLLAGYSAFFGIMGLLFAWLLGHPTIGLANTDASPSRIFGWIFYFFVEGYSPFVVSVFWAFANSVTSPDGAKKNYAYMVSASKLGGVMSAALAWYVFSFNDACLQGSNFDVFSHQVILVFSSLMLIVVPIVIYVLMFNVPGRYLHGYEAVYQAEKDRTVVKKQEGVFGGLFMLLKYPYVMGIFGMVFFYEIVATILGYIRLGVAQSYSQNTAQISTYLFEQMFWMHFIGVIFSLVGTSQLLKRLGERTCLLLVPLLSGVVLFYMMVDATPRGIGIAFVMLKAVNYAFAWPVRESLYIPTTKEIKFKAKSWIDAFGSKFAKSSGSIFNTMSAWMGAAMVVPVHSFFFATTVALWFVVAFFLGIRFERSVSNNKVIGLDEQ